MKNDKLILPWQVNDRNVLNVLKNHRGALLVNLKGDPKYSLDDLIDVGDLYIYKQETLDDFMNERTCGNIYLDSAFNLIDQLENYPIKNDLSSVYLATALAQKEKLSKKLTQILIITFAVSQNTNLLNDIEDFYKEDWNDFDKKFLRKIATEPYQIPKFEKRNIRIEFKKFSKYYITAKSFQDLYQLSRIQDKTFSLVNLQLEHSFELIQMALEMKNFFK